MVFSRITADPEELSILTTAFDNYCLAHDIVDEAAREGVARWIVLVFDRAGSHSRRTEGRAWASARCYWEATVRYSCRPATLIAKAADRSDRRCRWPLSPEVSVAAPVGGTTTFTPFWGRADQLSARNHR